MGLQPQLLRHALPEADDRARGRAPLQWTCRPLPLLRYALQEAADCAPGRDPLQSKAPRRPSGVWAVLCFLLFVWLPPQLLRRALREAGP